MILYPCYIISLSEHRLYNSQLFKSNELLPGYTDHSKSSSDLDPQKMSCSAGHCGILIAWKEKLDSRITVIGNHSDRICSVRLVNSYGKDLIIMGVYLPQQQCQITTFDEHLSHVEVMLQLYNAECDFVIMGDTNCHFGAEWGGRFAGITTKNAKKMSQLIERHSMIIVDQAQSTIGPAYSFHVTGVGTSYIDHIIVSKTVMPQVTACEVYSETLTNCSDHLAISVVLKDNQHGSETEDEIDHQKVNWRNLSENDIRIKYTNPLDQKLNDRFQKDVISTLSTSRIIQGVTDDILSTAKTLINRKKSSHLKPYWNADLNLVGKEEHRRYKEWVNDGRPREGRTYLKYKEAKRNFRQARRQSEFKYEMDEMQKLATDEELDQNSFWHFINKRRKIKRRCSLIDLGDKLITDKDNIVNKWGSYFKQLYDKDAGDNDYDDQFKQDIETKLKKKVTESYAETTSIMNKRISPEEVRREINKFKNNKAPGFDMVTAEHLKYGGENLDQILCVLFNTISINEELPDCLKKGIIVPIPKGDKDQTKMDNNRWITLLPILTKLYRRFF